MPQIIKDKNEWTVKQPIQHDGLTHILYTVYYRKDKAAYIGDKERGYYFAIHPVKIEYYNGIEIITGSPREGSLFFLKPTDRFKPADLKELGTEYLTDEYITGWMNDHGYKPLE